MAFVLVERGQRAERGDGRAMQDVVGVPAPDPRHPPLVAEHRVKTAGVGPGEDEGPEFLGEGIGAQLRQRSVVTRPEHPPPRLAFGAELLHQEPRVPVEAESRHGALWPRGHRSLLEDDPSALRQVHQDAKTVEREDQELAPAADRLQGQAFEVLGRGGHRLQRKRLPARRAPILSARAWTSGSSGIEPSVEARFAQGSDGGSR